MTLTAGAARVELPVRGPSELDAALRPFGPPESGAALAKEYSLQGPTGRIVHHDLASGTADVEFPWIDHRHVIADSGTLLAERNVAHYAVTEGDPLSAAVRVEVDLELGRGDWRTRVRGAQRDDLRPRALPASPRSSTPTRAGCAGSGARWDAGDPEGRRMRTIPWSWYEDPDVARRERDRIFRRSWQYAGRRDGAAPRRARTWRRTSAGLPVVLTRDGEDVLRAFANVCRHRGAIVARGAGERGTLQCPYHAWTYGLDGCLRAAPRTKGDPDFALDGLGLLPLALGTWGPFVFVNPDPDARPARGGARRPARRGPRARARRRRAALAPPRRVRDPGELEDRAGELPRVLPLPAQPPGPGLGDRRPAADDGGERAAREPVQPRAPGLRRRRRHRAGPVPPALPLAEGQRAARAAEPLDRAGLAGRARTAAAATSTTSSRPDASDEWIAEFLAFDDQVGAEDTALVEGAQLGAGSGLVAEGRLLAHDEQLIAHFQGYVREPAHLSTRSRRSRGPMTGAAAAAYGACTSLSVLTDDSRIPRISPSSWLPGPISARGHDGW